MILLSGLRQGSCLHAYITNTQTNFTIEKVFMGAMRNFGFLLFPVYSMFSKNFHTWNLPLL